MYCKYIREGILKAPIIVTILLMMLNLSAAEPLLKSAFNVLKKFIRKHLSFFIKIYNLSDLIIVSLLIKNVNSFLELLFKECKMSLYKVLNV